MVSRIDDAVHCFENRGGQFGLATVPTAPPALGDGAQAEVLRSTLRHLGRAGDGDEELATVWVQLRDGLGTPLSAAAANPVLASLSVWLDADDSGTFDPGLDQELASLGDFSSILMSGVIGVALDDGDPAVVVSIADPLTFFLVAETTADASAQGIAALEITYLPGGRSNEQTTAEDRDHDLPLVVEHAPDAIVVLELGLLFADGFESGNTSAWSETSP